MSSRKLTLECLQSVLKDLAETLHQQRRRKKNQSKNLECLQMRTDFRVSLKVDVFIATKIVRWKANALQCDLCQNWVYSECEGISSELYKQLNNVFSGIINVSYYCELNCCNNRVKQLLADWKLSQCASSVDVEEVNKSVQSLSSRYDSLTQSCQRIVHKN